MKNIEDNSARAAAPIKLEQNLIASYFKPEQSGDEIKAIIIKALDMYFGR